MDQLECINQGFLTKQNQYIWIIKIEIGSCDFGGYEVNNLQFYKLLIRINLYNSFRWWKTKKQGVDRLVPTQIFLT